MPHSCPRPLTRSRLVSSSQGGRPIGVYLLTIEYAGRAWRWSTRAVDVSTTSGDVYSYGGGLDEVDVTRQIAALQDSPELLSVSVTLDWPGIAALIGAGHDLSAATGEVALHLEGEDWEDRVVYVSGQVDQPQYGYDGDPVRLSVQETPYQDAAIWPPADACVTDETWPSAPEASYGKVYPYPFGTPGVYTTPTGSTLRVPGSPAIVVTTSGSSPVDVDTLLISGAPVEATGGRLWYDGETSSVTIETIRDALGRAVAAVDLTGEASGSAIRTAASYYMIWDDGGAIVDDRTGAAITGAGALIRWWLDRSTVRVDSGRWASWQRHLDSYRISGYVDEQVTPWEWISDNLIPILPISVIASDAGLAPVVWRWDASTSDAVETIRAEAGTVLDGLVEYSRTGPSEVRVSWAVDAEARAYRRTTVVSPTLDSIDYHTSTLARTSAARAGGGQVEQIETDWIADAATAYLVAVSTVAVRGYASRSLSYETGQDRAWLEPGDVVRLIDDGLSIDGPAMVTSWRYLDVGRMLLDLTIPGQPLRDRRTTGPDPTGSTYDDPGTWGT